MDHPEPEQVASSGAMSPTSYEYIVDCSIMVMSSHISKSLSATSDLVSIFSSLACLLLLTTFHYHPCRCLTSMMPTRWSRIYQLTTGFPVDVGIIYQGISHKNLYHLHLEIRMRNACRNSINTFDYQQQFGNLHFPHSYCHQYQKWAATELKSAPAAFIRNISLNSLHWIIDSYLTFKIGLIPNQNLCWKDTSNTDF